MFEGYTLGDQQKFQEERGWKPGYSALTYCTAEATVIYRPHQAHETILDWEILEAERVTGAPDCIGRRQGKWGTYVMPAKDPSAHEAVLRCIAENFGKDFPGEAHFAGIIGPWLHKATAYMDQFGPVLRVLPEQGEQTPFQAMFYVFDAYHKRFDPQGGHAKATKDLRWTSLRKLIAKQGKDGSYLYWQMVARAVARLREPEIFTVRSVEPRYLKPGSYFFLAEDAKKSEQHEALMNF